MFDEIVSQYLKASALKDNIGAIDFFVSVNALYKDRAPLSAAWLRGVSSLKNMNLKRRLRIEWVANAKARKDFWDRLDKQDRDHNKIRNLFVA
ncbi:hypothetical protein BGW42_001366 [Actinomortierella wolfii]|nr:hypothetical protein BGW42_001366 [Actinomortierella wolfii]